MSWPLPEDGAAHVDAAFIGHMKPASRCETRASPEGAPRASLDPRPPTGRRAGLTRRATRVERITALCGTALNVPICLVSLVDERAVVPVEQRFRSTRGTGAAFCAHSIMPDATTRVHKGCGRGTRLTTGKDSALVQGRPHIRFMRARLVDWRRGRY